MKDVKVFKQSDLVLQVNPHYDPEKLDLEAWDSFLYKLCENRTFQMEAIKNAIIFLASDRYTTTEDLVVENYQANGNLQQKYSSINEYVGKLQLPNKLFANIDLATGTGKSYVIYGIAQIMLGLGLVDKVLVLCPSVTIRTGLTEKFQSLSGDSTLKGAIPENAKCKNPSIINADATAKKESICITNIHAVYQHTGSSIDDSYKGQGERVLVLNDESHHIFNRIAGNSAEAQGLKKWKEFLLTSDFNFTYILGFTGTAYHDNEYFNDVIYRYSLHDAIADRIVKNVEYVEKDDSTKANEKMQKIYQNHKESIDRYPKIKPLTIMVTGKVSKAKELYKTVIEFLAEKENLSEEAVKEKVLIVTSHAEHATNVPRLKTVDEKDDSVEWIISVSMLTEGWDVKNVLQIVPWEDRVFNSKLLIAQVLGRGLRIPENYASPPPNVIVYNHDAWSKNIRHLVDEILQIETKITSRIMQDGERTKYNFDVYNLDTEKENIEVERPVSKLVNYTRIEKEGIKLDSQTITSESETEFGTAVGGFQREKKYLIEHRTQPIKKVIDKIYDAFASLDWEGKTMQLGTESYTQDNLPPRERIEAIIIKSMQEVNIKGNLLVESNVKKILNAFDTLLRKKSKKLVPVLKVKEPFKISTKRMHDRSERIGRFRQEATLFHTGNWKNEIAAKEQEESVTEIIESDDFPRSAASEQNEFCFKTPLNFVFANYEPEREFVKNLCKDEHAKIIDAWVKSRDRGFYSIEYSQRYGSKRSKTRQYGRHDFNPDFFIKVTKDDIEYILVVETKSDGDDSPENIAKYKSAKKHFERLNEKLLEEGINQKYIFHFLSPDGYSSFFEYLKKGWLFEGQEKYRSPLEGVLEESEAEEQEDFLEDEDS